MTLKYQLPSRANVVYLLGITIGFVSWLILLAISPPEARVVYYPMTGAILAVVWLIYRINARDGRVGILDIGLLCALATLLYTIVPLINFIAGDFSITVLGDSRLQGYQPTSYEIGMFHWRHVLYLWTFVVLYLLTRGGNALPERPRQAHVSNAKIVVVIALLVLFALYFIFLDLVFGHSINPSYDELMEQRRSGDSGSVPLLVRQISHYLWGMFFILKLCLLYVVLSKFHNPLWRVVFVIWIASEIAYAVYVMGARTQLILLLIGAVILFDHLVHRIKLSTAAILATILLASFLLFGFFRGLSLNDTQIADVNILTVSNEFQALLGTAFDVWKRTEDGSLVAPWYVHLYDFISLFPPQQIFPFEKQSASQWYLEATGRSGLSGKMWGVISQSIIGYGWIELALRGAILGLICGLLHRNFVRNHASFMTTLLYVWLSLTVYYTFRATTFYATVWYLYEFIPVFLMLKYLPQLLIVGKKSA